MKRYSSIIIGGGIFLIAILLFGSQFKMRNVVVLGLMSYQWAEVDGEIISSNMKSAEDRDEVRKDPEISPRVIYQFKVDGKEYEGYNLRFTRGLLPRAWVPDDMSPFQAGQKTKVYYNPDNPNENVLIRGFKPVIDLEEYVFIGVLVLVLLILMVHAIRNRLQSKRLANVSMDRQRREAVIRQREHQESMKSKYPKEYFTGMWNTPDGLIELKENSTWEASVDGKALLGSWGIVAEQLHLMVTEGEGRNDPMVGMRMHFDLISADDHQLQLCNRSEAGDATGDHAAKTQMETWQRKAVLKTIEKE